MDYDILGIIDDMELDFISRIRKHEQKYIKLGCEDWKKMQLRELQSFKAETKDMIEQYYKAVEEGLEYSLKEEYMKAWERDCKRLGKTEAFNLKLEGKDPRHLFHKVNDKRMVAMIDSVKNDFKNACYSLYRQSDDIYRKLIFKSTAMVNSGSYDLVTAINAANRQMMANGIQSVPYKSKETGKIIRRVTTRAYCEMALRTNSQRAAITAEGMLRDYLEDYLVRVSVHQSSCPLCGAWEGKILFDDVYSHGEYTEEFHKYKKLSEAIENGLLHPNCRHILATIDPDVDDDYGDYTYTEEDKKRYDAEQKQRQYERELRALKRVEAGTVEGNAKIKKKQEQLAKHLKDNPKLARKRWRESDGTATTSSGPRNSSPATPKAPKKPTPPKIAKTVEEAREMLVKDVGFKEVDKSCKKINDELLISSTNQLAKLEDKFGVIHKSISNIRSKASGNTCAYVSCSPVNFFEQNLSLCPRAFKTDKKTMIDTIKEQITDKWVMPAAEKHYDAYYVTHEYGHMIQNVLVGERMKEKGWKAEDPQAFVDKTKNTQKGMTKWYLDILDEVESECYHEIIKIARENNSEFTFYENISRYGQSSKAEFFAEVFANSQLEEPNELGKAMNIWLERKGIIKK